MTDRDITPRDEAIADLFTTALEGGIGGWSAASEYRWRKPGSDPRGRVSDTQDVLGFRAVIHEVDEDEEDGYSATPLVIDRFVIRRGMQRLYKHMIDLGDEASRYQKQACRDFTFGNWDDFDFDADTADMAVQFGLFNTIRYQ